MWSKAKSLLTAKLNVWVVFAIVVVLVGVFIVYQHLKTDHDSLHVMVSMFNNCLSRPDCKALFMAPTPGK